MTKDWESKVTLFIYGNTKYANTSELYVAMTKAIEAGVTLQEFKR